MVSLSSSSSSLLSLLLLEYEIEIDVLASEHEFVRSFVHGYKSHLAHERDRDHRV